AEALLMPLAAAAGRSVVLAEIAGDDDLEARYGIRIPVLRDAASGREIGWPFDEAGVLALIAAD
ncbi:MAG: glutaredoxin family protein, partial [Gammaproteobacteria bacterium]